MNDNIFVEIIKGVFGVITALIPRWSKDRSSKPTDSSKELDGSTKTIKPGPLGELVLSRMNLSEDARTKLARSDFIRIGGTRDALFDLVGNASKNDAMLAICGYKGDYSTAYYEENFKKCKAVRRVFSYEAIRDEIENRGGECNALRGLQMHLGSATEKCDVEVFFLPAGILIGKLRGGDFDPPFSFGLAILRDGNEAPKKAVLHWETDAKRLKHLVDIEGVIIDETQEELLGKLVKLFESIASGNGVLSSNDNRDQIAAICAELEGVWESRQSHPATKEETKR